MATFSTSRHPTIMQSHPRELSTKREILLSWPFQTQIDLPSFSLYFVEYYKPNANNLNPLWWPPPLNNLTYVCSWPTPNFPNFHSQAFQNITKLLRDLRQENKALLCPSSLPLANSTTYLSVEDEFMFLFAFPSNFPHQAFIFTPLDVDGGG